MLIICTTEALQGQVREVDEELDTWFQAWVQVSANQLGLMIYPKPSWMAIQYVPNPKDMEPRMPAFIVMREEPVDDLDDLEEDCA